MHLGGSEAMVSFHTKVTPIQRNTVPEHEITNSSKKRRLEELDDHEVDRQKMPVKAKSIRSIFDTHLHLETPLPLEWQRCLDIKSGQIHYYNTRTQKRTSKDPRLGTEAPPISSPGHMSLDLELNLPCGSISDNHGGIDNNSSGGSTSNSGDDHYFTCSSRPAKEDKKALEGLTRTPSWLAFEGEQREMVMAVCKRCHLLVMMCKSSPACPNCKFMHPPDQTQPNLFKQGLSLLC